jgi:E3 SUMO-protein ligase PIAS1
MLLQADCPLQKYNLFVYLVRKFSVEELTQRIKRRNVITRESVLDESKMPYCACDSEPD